MHFKLNPENCRFSVIHFGPAMILDGLVKKSNFGSRERAIIMWTVVYLLWDLN